MARLDEGTRALFGCGLDGDLVRERIRHGLADDVRNASVRVYVIDPESSGQPSILVTVREPASMPSTPRRLQSVSFQRPLAHIKHIGGFGQAYYGRLALRPGSTGVVLRRADRRRLPRLHHQHRVPTVTRLCGRCSRPPWDLDADAGARTE
jgi:hypothetical protein